MGDKKVVAFIVEGLSDEAALGSVMKGFFSSNEVRFVVVHGDITTRDYVNASNIIKKIDGQIKIIINKYRYKPKDFLKVIHVVDTDGVYIPAEDVKLANVEEVQYFTDHMESRNPGKIIERNKSKGAVLFRLRSNRKVNGIPYRVYFNSCNLEHVLYGELKSFTDEEKEIMSDDFADRYEGKADEFIKFISNQETAVPGTYQETWEYIEKEHNSLNRHTNMHLIFRDEQ